MSTKRALPKKSDIFIGTAGWAIRSDQQYLFAEGSSHLARYATRFNGVEINSSFYRPHRTATYAKWAAAVPDHFQFSVKVPRAITHEARFADADTLLERLLGECTGLGEKLGPLLLQLPPSLSFDDQVAPAFFAGLRARYTGSVVLEPRNESWFAAPVDRLLQNYAIGRVAADPVPAKVPAAAASPAGNCAITYFRLHGSPQIYYSNYDAARLRAIADRIRQAAKQGAVWCVFDNTALGHAAHNAAALQRLLAAPDEPA